MIEINELSEIELQQLLYRVALRLQQLEDWKLAGTTGSRRDFKVEFNLVDSNVKITATVPTTVQLTSTGATIVVREPAPIYDSPQQ